MTAPICNIKGPSGGIGNHGARVFNSADISIPSGAGTILTFNSERWDTDGFHSTSSNTSRLVVPSGMGGVYIVGANIAFAYNSAGERFAYVLRNGGNSIALSRTNPVTSATGAQTAINFSAVYALAVGDYVELGVYQSSGISINIQATLAEWGAEFWLQQIA